MDYCYKVHCSGVDSEESDCDYDVLRKEKRRLRINWIFLVFLAFIDGASFTSMLTTFHQYVINPRVENLGNQSKILPGLGETEHFFSLAITTYNIGTFVGVLLSAILRRLLFPYWHLLMMNLVFVIVGYVIRALFYQPGVIIISSFLLGHCSGAVQTLLLTYFAQSTNLYEKLVCIEGNKENVGRGKLIRNRLFTAYFIFSNFGRLMGNVSILGLTWVSDINIFDAYAWLNVALGTIAILLQVLFFHEKMIISYSRLKASIKEFSHSFKTGKSFIDKRSIIISSIFLLTCRGVTSIPSSFSEVLFNPLLSDYFGFSEKLTGYFFMGIGVIAIIGGFIDLFLKSMKLSTRNTALIGVIGFFIGASLLADWQAIPSDPCTEQSPFHHPDIVNQTYYYSTLQEYKAQELNSHYIMLETTTEYMRMKREVMVLTPQQTLIAIENCENITFQGHQCHWTPLSNVIPSYYCKDCQPICRSPLRSLTFIQFCFALLIFYIFYPINISNLTALMLDAVDLSAQGIVVALSSCIAMLARTISPIWADSLYELPKKRTFLVMSVTQVLLMVATALLLFSFCLQKEHTKHKITDTPTEKDLLNE